MSWPPAHAGRPIRAMQSFGVPRPTSNPYIRMLDDALARTPGVEHLRFDRRRALLGRYDVLQLHWPETLLGGSSPARSLARHAFALALEARLRVSRVAVVRTVHNLEPHEPRSRWERRWLRWLERRTDHRILLAPADRGPVERSSVVVHGHYRDWFAGLPRAERAAVELAFVGLVRPYKGVEELVDAFTGTASSRPDLRLRIAGLPASTELEQAVRSSARRDARIELDLRHLPEADFVLAVTRASGVVLPYRRLHSSGAALAALSLERPVLVPRTPVTEALAREVGPGWVTTFDGAISARALLEFAELVREPPSAPPDLAARSWSHAGAAHRDAFERALEHRRSRR